MQTDVLGPEDLVLCAGSAPAAGFVERARAAAEAGFAGVSLFLTDYDRARAEGLSDADLRRVLADHGLVVAELDPLIRWLPGMDLAGDASDEGAAFFRYGEQDFYRVADALGAGAINTVVYTDRALGVPELGDLFGGLCERAAAHGLRVVLEFLPWTQVPDAKTALAVVEHATPGNGGIMLDAWHWLRGGGTVADVKALPGARVGAVQLSDAPAQAEANLVEETLKRRRLPGAGDADLVGLVRALDDAGSCAPIGVEVFSEELAARPADEIARRCAQAAQAVLKKARG